MYDLSAPNDVIQQMRDADLSDAEIIKTLRIALRNLGLTELERQGK